MENKKNDIKYKLLNKDHLEIIIDEVQVQLIDFILNITEEVEKTKEFKEIKNLDIYKIDEITKIILKNIIKETKSTLKTYKNGK